MWLHTRLLQVILIVFIIMTGFYPLYYDHQRMQFRKSKLLNLYAFVQNGFILFLLPLQLFQSLVANYRRHDFFPSVVYMDMVLIVIRNVSIPYMLLTRKRHEQELCDIVVELSCLYRKMNSRKGHLQQRFGFLMNAKIFTASCLLILSFMNLAEAIHRKAFNKLSTGTFLITWIFLLSITELHYYAVMLAGCNLLVELKNRLLGVWNLIASGLPAVSTEERYEQQLQLAAYLSELCTYHAQISKLLNRLNDTYKFKLLIMYSTYFVTNLSFCYIALLLGTGFYPMGKNTLIVNFITSTVCFVDLLLIITLTDRFAICCNEVVSILRNFIALSEKDFVLVQRSSELMTLQNLMWNFEVNVMGLFVINRNTVFTFAASALMYIVFLIQTDYQRKIDETESKRST